MAGRESIMHGRKQINCIALEDFTFSQQQASHSRFVLDPQTTHRQKIDPLAQWIQGKKLRSNIYVFPSKSSKLYTRKAHKTS
jgi:hypothetical protein